jgi:hypothetical protein
MKDNPAGEIARMILGINFPSPPVEPNPGQEH